MIDLTKFTDPIRNSHWWTRERFYLHPERPEVRWCGQIGSFRCLIWGPKFFISCTWRTWQCYFGWGKCDATRTYALWRGDYDEPSLDYVLTWTFAEMFAFRKRTKSSFDTVPIWQNMGGA